MEIKLKKGGTYKIKNITLDERDTLLDSVSYDYNADGSIRGVTMMHSTMTRWLRTCVDEKNIDEFIMNLKLEEKTQLFTELQTMFFTGEGKASK